MASQNLQQKVYENIHEGLEEARAALHVPLIFGHLCKGDLEKPGVLRVSDIVGKTATWVNVPNSCDHNTAFLHHVQRFGREKTLLNWLVCWTRSALANIDRTNSDVFVTASFLVHAGDGPLVDVDIKGKGLTVQTMLSKDLLRSLLPEGLARSYLTTLYADAAKRNEELNEFCGRSILELELLTANLQTLRMLKQCPEGTENFSKLCQVYSAEPNGSASTTPTDAQMLQLLSALQIAFAYGELFPSVWKEAGGFVSVSRPDGDTFKNSGKGKSLALVPIFAASTGVKNLEGVDDCKGKLNAAATNGPLLTALLKLSNNQGAASARGERICSDTKFSSDSAQRLTVILKKHVPNLPFKDWSQNAATWIAHLVSSLRGAKHEGGPLEFTFAMGDMAQIEDSAAFERQSLADAGFDFPPPHDETDESKMIDSLNAAKRAIEKENYFWFQAGRYALLWDFTFPEEQPRYLLGLKDSSWHVFIANSRNRQKPATADAALVVGYLDDRGGGGLIVGGEHAFSLSQKGEWIQRGEALSKRVEDYLKAAGKGILSDDETATLVKALIAVSNDPDTGCMLVLANSKACPPFETMGHPWKVSPVGKSGTDKPEGEKMADLSDEKMLALLGMDGAACVWKGGDSCHIAFRKLACPPASNEETRPVFSTAKNALSGEGSRKWSAFLAASRTDVNLIVAVSQDGPVHFYTPLEYAKAAHSNDISATTFKHANNDAEVVHDKVS